MKILLVSEFTGLGSTGYSNYYKEIAKALHHEGHEVIELASYGDNNDPSHLEYKRSCPWKVILNYPESKFVNDVRAYEAREKASGDAKFGSWAFDVICAQEHPDIVIAVRDHWYDKFIIDSPAAKYYVSILSPTVDSRPQKADWLDTFGKTDIITTYNKWSEDWLKTQYSCHNLVGFISPCAASEYRVLNKKMCRRELNLPENARIVGTVMRNQKRKRFPELFEAISKTKNIYLYCHTAYPDKGWDIPDLILKNNIQDKCYLTYMCTFCGYYTASLYSGRSPICPKCSNKMETPNARRGLNNDTLCKIYNAMDLYVQPHIAEGFGIPVIEAAKCGVRCVSTNYSAQEDIIPKVLGIPLKPLSLETEIETGCLRASIDVDDLVAILSSELSYNMRSEDIVNAYNLHYNWNETAKKWIDLVNSVTPKRLWDSPPDIKIPLEYKNLEALNFPNREYVMCCILNVACEESLLGSHLHAEMLDALNAGFIVLKDDRDKEGGILKIDRKAVYNKFRSIRENINLWESQKEKTRSLYLEKKSLAKN